MSWTKTAIHDLLIRQKAFFQTGKTLSIPFRMEMLRKLRQAVIAHEQELTEALEKDLGRHPADFLDLLHDEGVVYRLIEVFAGCRYAVRISFLFEVKHIFKGCAISVYAQSAGL